MFHGNTDNMNSGFPKQHFAVVSGALASAASVFGKLSGLQQWQDDFVIRLVFFALMILCNAFMWTFFVKALQTSKSSLTPTILSAASNYGLSTIVGWVLFDEQVGYLWPIGTALILAGMMNIASGQEKAKLDSQSEGNSIGQQNKEKHS